jgi:hypothetical protein
MSLTIRLYILYMYLYVAIVTASAAASGDELQDRFLVFFPSQ